MQAGYNIKQASKKIQQWQEESRLKGKEVAKKADVSPAYYTNIRLGKQRGSIEALSKICRVLGHEVGELLNSPTDTKNALPVKASQLRKVLRPVLGKQTNQAVECLNLWMRTPDALRRALKAFASE